MSDKYNISYGSNISGPSTASAEEEVSISITSSSSNKIDPCSIRLSYGDATISIINNKFIMPAHDCSISAEFYDSTKPYTKMADSVMSAMSSDPTITTLGNAIKSYLIDNTSIKCTWIAFNSDGDPDPNTSITDSKLSGGGDLPPNCTSYELFATAIMTSLLAPMIISSSSFNYVPMTVATSGGVSIPTSPYKMDTQVKSMTALCKDIISGIEALKFTSAGTHSKYTGTATSVSFKVS
jgi:hypothetical protein